MNIILGPPGTGKTRTLLNLAEEYLAKGIDPRRIGFLAFTKKAADEAKTRAKEQFGFTDTQLVFFRTIHSLAFRQLSLSTSQVIGKEQYQELGEALGLEIQCYVNLEDGMLSQGTAYGDQLLFIDNLARVKQHELRDEYDQGQYDVDWHELLRLSKALKKFKEAKGLIDFTDMLELFVKQGVIPELDVLFIDEAQDLSMLQWVAIWPIIKKTKEVYICGDDDQSIFRWAGAATDHFISLPGDVQVLNVSWRVPRSVQRVANEVITQVGSRRSKVWESRDSAGTVDWASDLDSVPLDTGNWLLLARNIYLLKKLEDYCMENGFSFEGNRYSPLRSPALAAIKHWETLRAGGDITPEQEKKMLQYRTTKLYSSKLGIWHEELDRMSPYEREYFIAARRRGEPLLLKTPRIKISTIHGAKGGEADNVLLLTDMAYKTYQEMQMNPDDEARVFYVGVTRAKENLYIMSPQTSLYYSL
jgi:superfamily I DNA/RNA helicase